MNDLPYLEIAKTGTTIGFLAVAVHWLAQKWQAAQTQLVTLLTGALDQNSALLREVRDVLKNCHDNKAK